MNPEKLPRPEYNSLRLEAKRFGVGLGSLIGAAPYGSTAALGFALTALSKDMPESNDLHHSCRVLRNCRRLVRVSESILESEDRIILLYACILHDLAKTRNSALQKEISESTAAIRPLFAGQTDDHGFRAAAFLEKRVSVSRRQPKSGSLWFPGLTRAGCESLLAVIEFHSLGIMGTHFSRSTSNMQTLLLCLLFRLADVADASELRALASVSAAKEYQDGKVRARGGVQGVRIGRREIGWIVDAPTEDVERAVAMENRLLTRMAVMLQALGLPSAVVSVARNSGGSRKRRPITSDELAAVGLSLGSTVTRQPLAISEDSLPALYERLVAAFEPIAVSTTPSPENYSGPLVLEVRDVAADKAEQVRVRSTAGTTVGELIGYADRLLAQTANARDAYYSAHTHGERLFKYRYPMDVDDLDPGADASTWHGSINQYEHCRYVLATEGGSARRAYMVTANPVLDNPSSELHHGDRNPPSLLVIHFTVEKGDRLCGYGLLRSQEVSTFALVNYFEIRSIMSRLIADLAPDRELAMGRIVLMMTMGYLDQSISLLDRARISTERAAMLRHYALTIELPESRGRVAELLRDFSSRQHLKIDTAWAESFVRHIPETEAELRRLSESQLDQLKRIQNGTGGSRSEILEAKREALAPLIEALAAPARS